MGGRLTDKKAVLRALDGAIQWELSIIDACLGHDCDMVADARANIAAYRRVNERITRNRLTLRELYDKEMLRGSKLMTIQEIRKEHALKEGSNDA